MRRIRTYSELREVTASDIEGQLAARQEKLRRRLADVRHTLAVMSGKGGVGKSVVTASLAAVLAEEGSAVGVLDADVNGPSMARLLGARGDGGGVHMSEDAVQPAIGIGGVKVMSMDLLLPGDESPVEWKGPERERFLWQSTLEANAVREFLADTEWGSLDYLLLDLPPGTGSLTAVRDVLPRLGGVVAVTLPSALSRLIVGKSLTLARRLGLPLIGYVENMAGYVCPDCGALGPLFTAPSTRFGEVRRLASLPFDPTFGREMDAGRGDVLARPDSEVGRAVRALAAQVRTFFEDEKR